MIAEPLYRRRFLRLVMVFEQPELFSEFQPPDPFRFTSIVELLAVVELNSGPINMNTKGEITKL